jgi:outer membrane protein assembly factor BamE (lipoprotein component of BamABCDE complex)
METWGRSPMPISRVSCTGGMTTDQVKNLLGQPASVQRYSGGADGPLAREQ